MKKMMVEVAAIIQDFQGSLTGEHGDGYLRSYLNEKIFGKEVYQAFREIKQLFDPKGIFNPDKIIASEPIFDENRSPKKENTFKPFLDFSKEGGFELAADLCNGNALCRKKEGLMCPSYQASLNEKESTRARAQVLRSFINGHLSQEEFISPKAYEVFDLCLSCKGCKSQCPSQVDIAKFKAEFLYHYQKKYPPSLRNRLLANLHELAKTASPFSRYLNPLAKLSISKSLLKSIGIQSHVPLPSLAPLSFMKLFKNTPQKGRKKSLVYLFLDTYTQFFRPELGIKALKVLNALDYQVKPLPLRCCGRVAYSKGFLEKAQKQAQSLSQTFLPYANKGHAIIGLEPSCTYMIKDEMQALIPKISLDKLINRVSSFETFVNQHLKSATPHPFTPSPYPFSLHTHCHQKASHDKQSNIELLNKFGQGFEMNSGCCGMAGSFGYESEHSEFSKNVYSHSIKPHLANHHQIVTNGFSCSHQISYYEKKTTYHIAEYLYSLLKAPFR